MIKAACASLDGLVVVSDTGTKAYQYGESLSPVQSAVDLFSDYEERVDQAVVAEEVKLLRDHCSLSWSPVRKVDNKRRRPCVYRHKAMLKLKRPDMFQENDPEEEEVE